MKKIRAYLLRVDKNNGTIYRGYVTEMEHSLKAEQDFVNYDEPDGTIDTVWLTKDIIVILNDNGIAEHLPPNRIWFSENGEMIDILLGNVMCVRFDGIEDFADSESAVIRYDNAAAYYDVFPSAYYICRHI